MDGNVDETHGQIDGNVVEDEPTEGGFVVDVGFWSGDQKGEKVVHCTGQACIVWQ